MKILAVSPVPQYATWDVWQGQVAGLRACGADVLSWNYSRTWTLFSDFREMMVVTGRARFPGPNPEVLAGERIIMTALDEDVDLVYFVAAMHTAGVTIERLRKLGIKTAACFTESPYDDAMQLPFAELFDYCFIMDSMSLPRFREANPRTFYVGHAYDPERHKPNGQEKDIDCIFITTLFPSRISYLEQTDWSGVDLHLYGIVSGLKTDSPLRPFVHGAAMDNSSTVKLYQRSRVGIQMHRTDTVDQTRAQRDVKRGKRRGVLGAVPVENLQAHSIGPRSYELAACGVFQVSDDTRPELREVFGDTVPTFGSPGELGSLLRRYLDDPVGREKLAVEQHEAVRPYTFEARMRTVLEAVA